MDIGFFLFIILKEALTFTLISPQLSTGLTIVLPPPPWGLD